MEAHAEVIEGVEGVVKWFDPRKGFGFIVGPHGQDIFTHYTVIQGEGFRALKDGSIVTYDAVKTEKGWKATRVTHTETIEIGGAVKRGYARASQPDAARDEAPGDGPPPPSLGP